MFTIKTFRGFDKADTFEVAVNLATRRYEELRKEGQPRENQWAIIENPGICKIYYDGKFLLMD